MSPQSPTIVKKNEPPCVGTDEQNRAIGNIRSKLEEIDAARRDMASRNWSCRNVAINEFKKTNQIQAIVTTGAAAVGTAAGTPLVGVLAGTGVGLLSKFLGDSYKNKVEDEERACLLESKGQFDKTQTEVKGSIKKESEQGSIAILDANIYSGSHIQALALTLNKSLTACDGLVASSQRVTNTILSNLAGVAAPLSKFISGNPLAPGIAGVASAGVNLWVQGNIAEQYLNRSECIKKAEMQYSRALLVVEKDAVHPEKCCEVKKTHTLRKIRKIMKKVRDCKDNINELTKVLTQAIGGLNIQELNELDIKNNNANYAPAIKSEVFKAINNRRDILQNIPPED